MTDEAANLEERMRVVLLYILSLLFLVKSTQKARQMFSRARYCIVGGAQLTQSFLQKDFKHNCAFTAYCYKREPRLRT